MAIAFAQIHYISRAKGHSSVAAIAYRSGEKLFDERTGKTEDYHNRNDHIAHSEILLPEGADTAFLDREYLWNQVEAAEDKYNTRRSQAQVARDCVIALPRDTSMTHADHVELARRFAQEHFVQHGLVADINIHYDDPNESDITDGSAAPSAPAGEKSMGRNPHAHILVTTRRLVGDKFDRYKARDLNPTVAKGQVVDPDKVWHDEWRSMQNDYFTEKGVELEVDPNGIIAQVHLGKDVFHHPERENLNHWKENERRKAESLAISLADPKAILNQITLQRTVFTEADLAKLVDRVLTQQGVTDPDFFQNTLLKVKASNALVALGPGSDGKEYFTTRAIFAVENDIQRFADHLGDRHAHSVRERHLNGAMSPTSLTQEQREAVRYLVDGQGIRALVAPNGRDKNYVLAVARDAWNDAGYRVQGVAMSSNGARQLRANTNITSRTVEALRYGLRQGKTKLTKRDVLVIDGADMLDSHAYRDLLAAAALAGAKVVYTGDPHKGGEAMRALLERTGHIDLHSASRQSVPWQQTASQYLATGQSEKALTHYAKHEQLRFSENAASTRDALITDWKTTVIAHGAASAMITTVNGKEVAELNQAARAARVASGDLNQGSVVITEKGELSIAIGERLQLLKNDKTLGISNGDLVTVVKMARDKHRRIIALEVAVDGQSGKTTMIDLREYNALDYGYAARVNQVRIRDQVADHAFTYVSGWGWNRQTAYVANSHHRHNNTLYVDREHYADEAAVAKAFARPPQKDSLYDWPWHFRERRGMPQTDAVMETFTQHLHNRLQVAATHVRDKIEEKIRPDAYWSRKQRAAARVAERAEKEATAKAQHQDATRVYAYTEAAKTSGKLWYQLLNDQQKIEGRFDEAYNLTNHTLYQEAIDALAARDALAAELQADIPRYQDALAHYQIAPSQLEKQAASYTGREIVADYVKECAAGRELHRNKLAYTITQDTARFAAGMTAHGVDWKAVREQGRLFARNLLIKDMDAPAKAAFTRVESYSKAYINAAKKWQTYFKQKNAGDDIETLVQLSADAQSASATRDKLAAIIVQDKGRHQAGLHFYGIEKAADVTAAYMPYPAKPTADVVFAKRAVKLERYGQQHLARKRFANYRASSCPVEKSELADIILRYPGFHNRYIAKAADGDKQVRNDFYNALRQDAVVARRKRLLPRLSVQEADALPTVDHYFTVRQSLRAAWRTYFDEDKPDTMLDTLHRLTDERDILAKKLVAEPALYQKALRLYDIKPEHLEQSIASDACRERIHAFMSPFTPFAEKVAIADFMISERGAHMKIAQGAALDWFSVYPYADVKRHRALLDTLDLTSRGDCHLVGRYSRLRNRLARIMREKRTHNVQWKPAQQAKFDKLSAMRDHLASQLLDDIDRYSHYLDAYRLTPDKLQAHASRHTIVTAQLHVYQNQRVALINTFNTLVKQYGSIETLATSNDSDYQSWRNRWSQLSSLATQWERKASRLPFALEAVGLTAAQLTHDTTMLAQLDRLVKVATGHDASPTTPTAQSELAMPQPVALGKARKQFDVALIKSRLNECAEAVAMAAVSADETLNSKMSNGTKLIWGKKGGSLQVTISGNNVGYWNDFSQTGQGGRDLLGFIAAQQNLSFKDSLDWAARFLGLTEGDMIATSSPVQLNVQQQKTISDAAFSADEWKRVGKARQYWNGATPLSGTLAETYLTEHRGWNGKTTPEFYRFHPAVWNFDTKQTYPALLVGATNKKGQIQAVQAVFLTPDGKKISNDTSSLRKISNGVFKDTGVWLNGFDASKPTAIIEGPETAISILEAKHNEWNVVCACGAKNFKHINLPREAGAVILVLDNDIDNAQTEQNAIDTLVHYADRGVDALFVKPTTAGYDFNDVQLQEGKAALDAQLATPVLFRKGLDAKAELNTLVEVMNSDARASLMSPAGWQRETRRLATIDQTSMALDLLQQQSLLTVAPTHTDSFKDAVIAWGNSFEDNHLSLLVCANENDRELLNKTAHEYMRLSGALGDIHNVRTETGTHQIGINGTIRFTKDWDKKEIPKNTLATVQSIDNGKMCVRCDNGKKLTFHLSEYHAIENGYAVTPKDALAKKCDKTFMFASKGISNDAVKSTILAGKEMSLYYNKEQFTDYNGLKKAVAPRTAKPKPKKPTLHYNSPTLDM